MNPFKELYWKQFGGGPVENPADDPNDPTPRRKKRKAQDDAMRDLWRRLYEPVKHMAEKLADPEGKFKDTLVSNIREIAGLLTRLNVAEDPNLEELRKEVEAKLCGQAPETLRTDATIRTMVAADARQIADVMRGYMGG